MITLISLYVLAAQVGGGFVETFSEVGPNKLARLGRGVEMLGDLDGDGVEDYAASAEQEVVPGFGRVGTVRYYSGATHTVMRTLHGSIPWNSFGFDLCNIGDLDGDGFDDLIISSPSVDIQSTGIARVDAYSSASGALLYSVTDGSGDNSFGVELANIGDVDSDGISDFLSAATLTNNRLGAAYLYSGATGNLIRTHLGAVGSGGVHVFGFGSSMGDLSGDGIPDYSITDSFFQVAGSERNGRVQVFSGANGFLLFEMFGVNEERFGMFVATVGDIDGDGIPEFAVTHEKNPLAASISDFAVSVFRGSNQTRLYVIESDQKNGSLGSYIELVPDMDGDGMPDFILSETSWKDAFDQSVGAVSFVSAATGDFLGRVWGIEDEAAFGNDFGVAQDLVSGKTSLVIGSLNLDSGPTVGVGAIFGYSLEPFLTLSASSISAAAGGQINFDLDFTPKANHANYVIYASLGVGPIQLGEVFIPLTNDVFLQSSRSFGVPMLTNGTGSLDSSGKANATWDLPPGALTAQSGLTLHFAAILLNGAGRPAVSSMESAITISP